MVVPRQPWQGALRPRCIPCCWRFPLPSLTLPLAASGWADQHHRGDFALPASSALPSLPHRSKGAFKPPLNTPDHVMETNPARIGCAPAFRRWIRPGRVPPMDSASGACLPPEPQPLSEGLTVRRLDARQDQEISISSCTVPLDEHPARPAPVILEEASTCYI